MALGTMEELEGKGILALDLRKDSSWEILNLVKGRETQVCMVETRSEKRKGRIRKKRIVELL